MVNTFILALLLLFLLLLVSGEKKLCNLEKEALVVIEVFTDPFPADTGWEINEEVSRDIIYTGGPLESIGYLYTFERCVNKTGCYEFTIIDSRGDGMQFGGYYNVFYNDDVILQGRGDFGFSDRSTPFGDTCASPEPSLSIQPSQSAMPSFSPSEIASNQPSISLKPSMGPSFSLEPTMTSSETPSSTPTIKGIFTVDPTLAPVSIPIEFSKDSLGRRRFPPPLLPSTTGNVPFQSIPNCFSSGQDTDSHNQNHHLGCISSPKPQSLPSPDWMGKLLQEPPSCDYGKCHLNIPESKLIVPTHLKPALSGYHERNKVMLPTGYLTNAPSRGVTTVDLNSDGHTDILIANRHSTPNQVLFNKGNGTFEDPIDLPGGAYDTLFIRVADLDGDDFIDIVITNYLGPCYILWNIDGSREFAIMDLPGHDDFAADLAFFDFNQDGVLDLVLTRGYLANLLLLNNGERNFTVTDLPATAPNYISYSVVCGDLNNDGGTDIIISNLDNAPNELLLNNGNGTFEVTILPGISGDTGDISLVDIDNNGYLDIVISNGIRLQQDPNQVLWNLGNGTFVPQDLPGGVLPTRSVNIADVTGDGQLDIIVSNIQNPHLILSYDRYNGNFHVSELPFVGPNPQYSALADIDGNGMLDIIFATIREGNQILMNYVDGHSDTFSIDDYVTVNFPGMPQNTMSIVTGPLDTSGHLDVVIANFKQPNKLLLINNEISRMETVTLPGGSLETSCIILIHHNADNLFDLFVCNINGPNQVLANKDNGEFELIVLPNSDMPTLAAAGGDLTNNGFMDLVIANRRFPNQILFNDGNGTYTAVDLPGNKLDDTMCVALADMNGDRFLDIIVGNGYDEAQPNYLLINQGNQGNNTFMSEELPGGSTMSRSVAIGDLFNNERLEVIFGNHDDLNYILWNNGSDFDVKYLPGGTLQTNALALGDVDDDGDLDIVISNGAFLKTQSSQIIFNLGNGTFKDSIIPNSVGEARSIAISDLDQDGRLDLVIGNFGSANTYFYQPTCENGAQLHSQSWCFKCPAFMGRKISFFDQVGNTCFECMPDHMQSQFNELCSDFSCSFGERELGNNLCTQCPNGTFYNSSIREEDNPASWKVPQCVDCDRGEFSDWTLPAIDECFKCASGSSQNNTRASSCPTCPPGTFQPLQGQATCNACKSGGYCSDVDSCSGGFTACDPGTYNNKTGQVGPTACIPCPIGTYSTKMESTSIENCLVCLPGSYSSLSGQTDCMRCPKGSHQPNEGSAECIACKHGTYSDAVGEKKCANCPYRTSSLDNSTTCEYCAPNFYLRDLTVDPSEIFMSPDSNCLDCPQDADCPFNTTLQTLIIPPNYWRESKYSAVLYECNHKACQGSSPSAHSYCIADHTGPLCQVCTKNSHYFSASKGTCQKCPSFWRLAIPASVLVGIVAIITMMYASKRFSHFGNALKRLSTAIANIGIQAKLKIFISFYQIINTLHDVYGVRLHERFSSWVSFFKIFNFGLLEFSGISGICFGSMTKRLIIVALWPLGLVLLLSGCILVFYAINQMKKRRQNNQDHESLFYGRIWLKSLEISIIILYLVLPSVAQSIFQAQLCRSFQSNDMTGQTTSYLVADWSVLCDSSNSDYKKILGIFWFTFALWLVLVPLLLCYLLMKIRKSVQSQQITPLAQACSFLWRDYNKEVMYWDIFDLIRKAVLTGLIMFVDTQEGSDKILRLVMAIVFSTFFSFMLLHSHPYIRGEDQILALISNLLLILCFSLGILIQLCSGDTKTCQEFVGLSLDLYSASLLAVILILSMVVISAIFLVFFTLKYTPDPIIKLKSTKQAPMMDLPPNCKHHVFLSHVWSSGQEKTHSLVEKLRKYLPEIKVWLDVENLTNMHNLEDSVGESAVFILVYTEGYFQSKNCRREVYAAVKSRRPTIVLYEGDENVINGMRRACLRYCTEVNPSSDDVLRHILSEDAMLWLGASSRYFATASVKELSLRILRRLPFYQNTQDLSTGLQVEGELGEVTLIKDCTLFFSKANQDAEEIARELQIMTSINPGRSLRNTILLRNTHNIVVEDFEEYSEKVGSDDRELFFLLYLNDKVFTDCDGELEDHVKNAIESGLRIILVHETDIARGGKPFNFFIAQTPRELLVMPYNLFSEIAITLHSFEEYRKISHRLILCKMCDVTRGRLARTKLLLKSLSRRLREE